MIPRKSYSAIYKLKVIEYSIEYSIKEAYSKFHIDPSMICRWKKRQDYLVSAKKTCRSVGKSGRPVAHSTEEQILYDWIIAERSNYLPVTFEDIQDKMLSLLPEPKVFKASYGWLKGFVSRYNLSNRIITGTNGKD